MLPNLYFLIDILNKQMPCLSDHLYGNAMGSQRALDSTGRIVTLEWSQTPSPGTEGS
jgi:hypothetical protein